MIEYSIKRLGDYVYEVIVPDDYDRAMLFMRAQEYVESPNPRFRGKSWDVWDYIKWYSAAQGVDKGCFSYAEDWAGFNLPLSDAIECYRKLPQRYLTDYDQHLLRIINYIRRRVRVRDLDKVYIIAYDRPGSTTMYHERSHACYFTNPEYRRVAKRLAREIPKQTHKQLVRNLHAMGYYKGVMQNELQAYLRGRDWNSPDFARDCDRQTLRRQHLKFARELGRVDCVWR